MNSITHPHLSSQLTRLVSRLSALALALCAALSFSGCVTSNSAFPSPTASWETFTGQLRYTSAQGRSIIGDVVIRRSPQGDFQLEFQSGAGFSLLRLWESAETARVEGLLSHGSWQGPASKAPHHLAGWVHLRETFAHEKRPTHVKQNFGGDRFDFHFAN
ncbi:MAG TPA: hypothetical protein VGH90_11515 [Chthoniobacteraceae bacterium]|jgi:hypothetical protein